MKHRKRKSKLMALADPKARVAVRVERLVRHPRLLQTAPCPKCKRKHGWMRWGRGWISYTPTGKIKNAVGPWTGNPTRCLCYQCGEDITKLVKVEMPNARMSEGEGGTCHAD